MQNAHSVATSRRTAEFTTRSPISPVCSISSALFFSSVCRVFVQVEHTSPHWRRLTLLDGNMDTITSEFEQQCAVIKRRKKYDRRNAVRQRNRLIKNRSLYPDLLMHERIKRATAGERVLTNVGIHQFDFLVDADDSVEQINTGDPIRNVIPDDPIGNTVTNDFYHFPEANDVQEASDLSRTHADDTESMQDVESIISDQNHHIHVRLHEYTRTTTLDYCEAFAKLARRANLCKTHTTDFLSFIEAGLPVPNHMPITEEKLLDLLAVEDLFTRRSICLLCHRQFDYRERVCPQCASSERSMIVHV